MFSEVLQLISVKEMTALSILYLIFLARLWLLLAKNESDVKRRQLQTKVLIYLIADVKGLKHTSPI